jgi:hypothetical protein
MSTVTQTMHKMTINQLNISEYAKKWVGNNLPSEPKYI